MNVFKAVKQSVTTRQAAEHFGIRVGRNGMCVCPFHADKNPSMKVDRRFHCFGCQADGDVIDFVSRLEAVSPKEAALMLAQDFSIPYEDYAPKMPEEAWHPLFVEALQKQSHVEYLLDVLLSPDMEERAVLIVDYGKEVSNLERRMAELAAGDTAGRRTDHARSTAAPER